MKIVFCSSFYSNVAECVKVLCLSSFVLGFFFPFKVALMCVVGHSLAKPCSSLLFQH